MTSLNLPSRLEVNKYILLNIFSIYPTLSQPSTSQVDFIIQCLTNCTENLQIICVNHLLKSWKDYSQPIPNTLILWLKRYYGPNSPNTHWFSLSDFSKTSLRRLIGSSNYQDFCSIIDRVVSHVSLQFYEVNQLKRRRVFWSNYSDRFERLLILLPTSTARLLGISSNSKDVRILKTDNSQETEICIFDFGNWFVVEFFRGKGSETRLYARKNSPWLEKLFVDEKDISIRCLRCQGGEVHDHMYLWQLYCERWLYSKQIVPNDNISKFAGLDHNVPYTLENGQQSSISQKQSEDRDKKLFFWNRDFSEIQKQAQNHCCQFWSTVPSL